MIASCICTRRGPIGRFDPNNPVSERTYRGFCTTDHEQVFANMTEQYLERFEVNAIVGALPEIGKAMAARGLTEKSFSQMSKDEICAVIADVVKSYRASMDREADFAKEIPF